MQSPQSATTPRLLTLIKWQKRDFLKIINLYRNGASSSNCAAIKKVEEDSNTDTTNGQIKEEKD